MVMLRESPSGAPVEVSEGGGGVVAFLTLNVADASVAFPSAATADTMLALAGEPLASFALAGDAAFTLGVNAVVTYAGPDITVMVQLTCSVFTDGFAGWGHMAVAHNGDLIGEAANDSNIDLVRAGDSMQLLGAGPDTAALAGMRRVTLTDGDTLQPVGGTQNNAGASDLLVLMLQLSVEAVAA